MYAVARGADHLLTSPVMQQPCIAYRLVVEEPGWRKVHESADCAPFFLAQDGEVMISVRGPFKVVLDTKYEWEFGPEIQRRITTLLHHAPWKDYRYYEAMIRVGDRISIEGFASVSVDPAGERTALREPPLLYTVAGTPERPAIVSIPERGSMAP